MSTDPIDLQESFSESSSFDSKSFLSGLTTSPGVYRMYGSDGSILYVGKAKHLKKRVSSYFARQGLSLKTQSLVSKIAKIEVT
ncbi:GIY-YIG nuclease family protein, partial [Oleiphilus sp. HI0132]